MFAIVFKCFFHMFLQVFQTHVSSVSFVFLCIFQVLHLDISKVDKVLHLLPHLLLPRLSVSSSASAALLPSQSAEGCNGTDRGCALKMAARTQAHPLPFRSAGRQGFGSLFSIIYAGMLRYEAPVWWA
jgi:hypothetical protein